MNVRGFALVDDTLIALEASSRLGLQQMVRSIGFVERTPEGVVENFEGYNSFHAEIVPEHPPDPGVTPVETYHGQETH